MMTKLLCRCGNMVGLRAPNGVVVSRRKGRVVYIELGGIVCEKCEELIKVDKIGTPALV